MSYLPPNLGGFPPSYPGTQPGGFPAGPMAYMQPQYPGRTGYMGQPGAFPGGQGYPGQPGAFPGGQGYPGQSGPFPGGQGYTGQPGAFPGGGYPGPMGIQAPPAGQGGRLMGRGIRRGPSAPGQSAPYGQMPAQYPGGPAGMGMPAGAAPGPGLQGPALGMSGGGGRSRKPGIATRLATGQQGNSGYNQAPAYPPPPLQQAGPGQKGLRLGKRNMPQLPQTPGLPAGPSVSPLGKSIKPKQFNLTAAGSGPGGSGIATINDANSFSLIANNLADPAGMQTNFQGPPPVYVAYLTNRKGQGSFAVGQLYPLGGGTYKVDFRSNVPFYDYDQVVVSLENPYSIGNSPAGPLVLASAAGAGISLPKPVKSFFSGAWAKAKGVGSKFSKRKKDEPTPEPGLTGTSLLSGYTLGPPAPSGEMITELPGLGVPVEDPSKGGNP